MGKEIFLYLCVSPASFNRLGPESRHTDGRCALADRLCGELREELSALRAQMRYSPSKTGSDKSKQDATTVQALKSEIQQL